MLELFDKNGNFWLNIEDCEWAGNHKHGDPFEKCISIEIKNTGENKKEDCVPDETTFIMSIKDAKYLRAYLDVAINNI